MSRAFFYTLQGGDKLLQTLRNYPKVVQEAISAEFEDSAQAIRSKAVTRAQDRIPGEFEHMSESRKEKAEQDLRYLAQGITVDKKDKLQYEIISGFALSAYFEFGTGRYVFEGESWVDGPLREYARTFYVNGKGITKPHPFLFNSFYEERVELIKRLKQILGAK